MIYYIIHKNTYSETKVIQFDKYPKNKIQLFIPLNFPKGHGFDQFFYVNLLLEKIINQYKHFFIFIERTNL